MTFDPQWPWYSPPQPTRPRASRAASSSSPIPLPQPAQPPGTALARALGFKGGELPNALANATPVVLVDDLTGYSPSYLAEKFGTRAFTGGQFTTVGLAGAAVVVLLTTNAVALGVGQSRGFVLEDLLLEVTAPAAMVGTLWSVLRSAPGVTPALPAQVQVPTVQDVGGDQPPRVQVTTGVAASIGPVSWIESGLHRELGWFVPADRFLLLRSVTTSAVAITYRVRATWRELPAIEATA